MKPTLSADCLARALRVASEASRVERVYLAGAACVALGELDLDARCGRSVAGEVPAIMFRGSDAEAWIAAAWNGREWLPIARVGGFEVAAGGVF